MKLIKIISLIVIMLIELVFSGCGKTSSIGNFSNHSWEIASESDAVFAKNIGGFLNRKYGITVGYSGEIHYTKNGGKTWSKGNNSSLCLFGLSIASNKVAYACGNGGLVVKTTDGGANWKVISSFGEYEPNQPRYLSFADEDTGWIATPNKFKYHNRRVMLGITKDGGKTWDEILLPEEIEEIVAIFLRTPENGYVLDNNSNLYITNDCGKSFVKQPLNIEDANLSNAKFVQHVVIRFLDENNGFIAYKDKNLKFRAARSIDGGKTWSSEKVPDLPNGALYLSQDGKLITLTKDGGFVKTLVYK